MAETYFLTITASDLSVPGDNWDNEINRTAPGATTLQQTVASGTTETDYGFTPSGDPSTDGGTGSRTWTVTVEFSTQDAEMEMAVNVHRINSTGTVQNSGTLSGEQTCNSATLTFTFSSTDLGTWASGDRFRVDFQVRSTAGHGNSMVAHTISSSGTRVDAPWTIAAGGPSAGLRTLALTGAGI